MWGRCHGRKVMSPVLRLNTGITVNTVYRGKPIAAGEKNQVHGY